MTDLNEKMAERTGLEPATPGVTGRYSNQLNYRSNVLRSAFLADSRYGLFETSSNSPPSLRDGGTSLCRNKHETCPRRSSHHPHYCGARDYTQLHALGKPELGLPSALVGHMVFGTWMCQRKLPKGQFSEQHGNRVFVLRNLRGPRMAHRKKLVGADGIEPPTFAL